MKEFGELFDRALQIAIQPHREQKDKSGREYIKRSRGLVIDLLYVYAISFFYCLVLDLIV